MCDDLDKETLSEIFNFPPSETAHNVRARFRDRVTAPPLPSQRVGGGCRQLQLFHHQRRGLFPVRGCSGHRQM